MRCRSYILFLVIVLSCTKKEANDSPQTIDVHEDIVIPKHYIVAKTSKSIVIDGMANESGWYAASFTDLFIDIEGVKIPKYKTRAKMIWDENYLYVFAQMEEPHVWGTLKQRDTIVYLNNDFEVFIDPSGTTLNYGEIEINALGTVWDLSLDKPYRNWGTANNHWNLNDLKSAVHISGTLNDPRDIDIGWSVELALPLKALMELRRQPFSLPKEGEQWRINFSRVEWDYDIIDGAYQRKKVDGTDSYQREYNWVWSPQKVINMHEPEKWGVLQFTFKPDPQNVQYQEDPDLLVKQTAYALFRKTNWGSLKRMLNKKAGYTENLEVIVSDTSSLNTVFYKTNFGFEYKIKSSHTNQVFIINERGILKTLQ